MPERSRNGFGRNETDEKHPHVCRKRKGKQVAATLDSAVEPRRSSRLRELSNRGNDRSEGERLGGLSNGGNNRSEGECLRGLSNGRDNREQWEQESFRSPTSIPVSSLNSGLMPISSRNGFGRKETDEKHPHVCRKTKGKQVAATLAVEPRRSSRLRELSNRMNNRSEGEHLDGLSIGRNDRSEGERLAGLSNGGNNRSEGECLHGLSNGREDREQREKEFFRSPTSIPVSSLNSELMPISCRNGFGRKETDEKHPHVCRKRKSKQVAATFDSAVEQRRSSRLRELSNRMNDRSEGERLDGLSIGRNDRSEGEYLRGLSNERNDRSEGERTGKDRLEEERTGNDRSEGERTGDDRSERERLRELSNRRNIRSEGERLHGLSNRRNDRSEGERMGNNRSEGERTGNDRSDGERTGNDRSEGEHLRELSNRKNIISEGERLRGLSNRRNDKSEGERAGNERSEGERMGNDRSEGERTGNDRSEGERTGNDKSEGEWLRELSNRRNDKSEGERFRGLSNRRNNRSEGERLGELSNRRNSRSEGKLNSINFECYLENIWRKLPEDKKNSFACLDSMWFASYRTKQYKSKVLRWIKNKDIFSKKYVFVPIVLWGHWCLLIFCHLGESLESESTTPCMLLLDSLQMADSSRFVPEIRKFVSSIFINEERPESKQLISKIRLLVPQVPQQRNATDCGKFVLYYISLFLESAPEYFSISEGYPYFMKEDWFTPDQLESFWQELQTVNKDSSSADGNSSDSDDVICLDM